MNFTGVTREVYDCLLQQAGKLGLPAPTAPSGTVSSHGVEVDYLWDEGSATLALTVTEAPEWLPCAMVESRVREAIQGCGAA
jgi:hypothetical protein